MGRDGGTRVIAVLVAGALAMGLQSARPAWGQAAGAGAGAQAGAGAGAQAGAGAGAGAGAQAGAKAGASLADLANAEEEARQFAEGMAAAKAQELPKARALLLRAYEVRKYWKIGLSLGRIEVRLGWNREAAEHLEEALRDAAPGDLPAGERQAAERLLSDARSTIATVAVVVNVDGAEVLVDGKVVGTLPLRGRLFLNPGSRVVEVRKGGYATAREALELSAGVTKQVSLEMKAEKGSGGNGGVTGGGKPAGDEESEGDGDAADVGTVYPNERARSYGLHPLVIGGLVATGVAALTGGAFVGVSFVYKGNAEAEHAEVLKVPNAYCTEEGGGTAHCKELIHSIKMKDAFANAAVWSFIGAGALGVGTVIFALVGQKSVQKAGVSVAPIVTSQGGAFALSGKW